MLWTLVSVGSCYTNSSSMALTFSELSAGVDTQVVEYVLGCDHFIYREAMRYHMWESWGALPGLNLLVLSKGPGQGYFIAKVTKESVSQDAQC